MDKSQTSCSRPPSVCSTRPSLFAMSTAAACLLFRGGFHISALSIQVPPGLAKRLRLDPCTLRSTAHPVRPSTADRLQPQYSLPGTALVGPLGQRLGYRAAGRSAAVTQCTARRHAMVRSATTNISCDGTLSIRRSLHSTASRVTVEQSTCAALRSAARDVQGERDVRCGGSPHRCGATV